jgi:membrane associated rhomboid family serine protease
VSIVVVTVAVWLVHEALITWASIDTDNTLADTGRGIHGQWWRLATAMVVHFGILHIALNMLVLWQIGAPVERVLGRGTFLASYVVCGIGGSVLSDLHYGIGVKSGGASGAIVGIVGILIGNTAVTAWAEARGRRSRQRWRFNPSVARSLGVQILVWIAFSSLFIPQIDNWAHVGGGVVGLVIGAAVGFARTEPPSHVPLDG